MIKRHKPGVITNHPDDWKLKSICSDCGLDIESWQLEDDDMGLFWTKWGVLVGNERASTLNDKCEAMY